MSALTTDNRDLIEIETELRARIEAQRVAIGKVREENLRLREENRRLHEAIERRMARDAENGSVREQELRTAAGIG